MNYINKYIISTIPKSIFLATAVLFAIVVLQCTNRSTLKVEGTLDEKTTYAGAYQPPAVRSYPANAAQINQWIDSLNETKIRLHAWDIWQSINTVAPNGLPIWENWFSGYEVFTAKNTLRQRDVVKDFESPSQFFHASQITLIPIAHEERPTSFNRFSPSLANFIYDNRFNRAQLLDSINNAFTTNHTPVVDRKISTSKDSIDVLSFALKPVFQFVSGDTLTALPYWAGISAQTTTNFIFPTPDTWRQCVVIDPSGKLMPGTKVSISCNGEAPKEWPVISMDDFYAIKITEEQAKDFSEFAATSGDDVGKHNKGDSTSVVNMVKPGNYALLTAMHVTGKEIVNWTWQTFWWSPDVQNPVFGKDRPSSIPKPWNNYNMRTAYYMVQPANAEVNGEPNTQFNPYLETNLTGTLSSEVGSLKSIKWYGVGSNCMSCHRMAAWKVSNYIPNGFIDPSNAVLFEKNTKTDFLWSIPTRAQ